jgi:hypothetical protein
MPTESPKDRGRSTENFGQGQSGYTAGRVAGDKSLQHEARNQRAAKSSDQKTLQGTDERFEGAGGLPWVPEEPAPDDEQKGP